MKSMAVAIVLFCSAVFAADQLAEKWQKRITDAETTYTNAVTKADNARFFAVQKANTERLAVLKKAMSDATKAGDFDAATALKEKVANAEKDGVGRAKPKNTVKLAGHEFALVEDKVTWHVAKRRCEEMGGHLVTLETPEEQEFVTKFCASNTVWCGATDEDSEGEWLWVTGSKIPKKQIESWTTDNENGSEHHLFFYPTNGRYMDGSASTRFMYICEWESK